MRRIHEPKLSAAQYEASWRRLTGAIQGYTRELESLRRWAERSALDWRAVEQTTLHPPPLLQPPQERLVRIRALTSFVEMLPPPHGHVHFSAARDDVLDVPASRAACVRGRPRGGRAGGHAARTDAASMSTTPTRKVVVLAKTKSAGLDPGPAPPKAKR